MFTIWVIENQGTLIPVIGYDVIYVFVSFFYVLTFRLIMEENGHEDIKQTRKEIKSRQDVRLHLSWIPLIILLVLVSALVGIAIYLPKVSTFILMGIPITSSILNLFTSERKPGGRRFTKTKKI